jgi:hypothetical protein
MFILVGGGDGEELGTTENDDDNRGDNEPLREQVHIMLLREISPH